MLPRGLGHGALGEALDGPTGSLAYLAALDPLAPGCVQPLVTEPEPQEKPHRGHPSVGEQKARYARLGDIVFVICCSRAHLCSPSLVAFTEAGVNVHRCPLPRR